MQKPSGPQYPEYLLLLASWVVVIAFMAVWFGVYLAKSLTTPIQELASATRKIAEAFDTIGLHDITVDTSTASADALRGFLARALDRKAEVDERVRAAESALGRVEDELRAMIRAARA